MVVVVGVLALLAGVALRSVVVLLERVVLLVFFVASGVLGLAVLVAHVVLHCSRVTA